MHVCRSISFPICECVGGAYLNNLSCLTVSTVISCSLPQFWHTHRFLMSRNHSVPLLYGSVQSVSRTTRAPLQFSHLIDISYLRLVIFLNDKRLPTYILIASVRKGKSSTLIPEKACRMFPSGGIR